MRRRWTVLAAALALAAAPAGRARAITADLTIQLTMTWAPTDLRDDGAPVGNGYSFGVNTTNALTATAYSGAVLPAMTGVKFQYSYPGQGWTDIGTDGDTSDGAYGVSWNVTGLPARADYSLRAVALDEFGNQDAGVPAVNCSVNQ